MTMRFCSPFIAFLFLFAATGGAGTEAQGQYPRRSPIVQAVQKTRAAVVTITIPKTKYHQRDTVGTGVVIDERGYIVTNQHVVGNRAKVHVALSCGKKVDGLVVQRFFDHDLAVVKVNAGRPLAALPLAPVSDLMVGETVIAMGHPFGYKNTVSVGIISALERTITMPTGEVLKGLIQTDAGINPGNSGGPLLNINGELIGINAAIRDGAHGIAFAINAGTVRDLLKTKLSALKVSGVGHGIECRDKIIAETGDRQRVQVTAVYQQTPAAHSGLRPGDEILAVAGQRVVNSFDVERALWDTKPGQRILMKVRRGDEHKYVALQLANGRGMNRTVKVKFSTPQENVVPAKVESLSPIAGSNEKSAPASLVARAVSAPLCQIYVNEPQLPPPVEDGVFSARSISILALALVAIIFVAYCMFRRDKPQELRKS